MHPGSAETATRPTSGECRATWTVTAPFALLAVLTVSCGARDPTPTPTTAPAGTSITSDDVDDALAEINDLLDQLDRDRAGLDGGLADDAGAVASSGNDLP